MGKRVPLGSMDMYEDVQDFYKLQSEYGNPVTVEYVIHHRDRNEYADREPHWSASFHFLNTDGETVNVAWSFGIHAEFKTYEELRRALESVGLEISPKKDLKVDFYTKSSMDTDGITWYKGAKIKPIVFV